MKYKILPHPAELRLRIYGKTIEELFENAVFAVAKIQKKLITLTLRSQGKCYKLKKICERANEEKIEIESLNINSLLVDFLSEVLAKSQINKCVYLASNIRCQISDVKVSLSATLVGYSVERFDEDIKAITYQDVDIKQIAKRKAQIWQTDLVLDI